MARRRPRWAALAKQKNSGNFGTGATAVTAGYDIQAIARSQKRVRSRAEKALSKMGRYRSTKKITKIKGAIHKGVGSLQASKKCDMLMKSAMKMLNRRGQIHESDRHYYTKKPIHLFKGKQRHCAGR